MMDSLFPLPPAEPPAAVPGLARFEDWIGEAEETELLRRIDAGTWRHDLKRRVQHFGYRYDYRARSVSRADHLGPLPGWLAPLVRRLADEGAFRRPPDQAIVNEYLPGQGISAHIDCVPCFGESVAVVSLGGSVVMEFRHSVTGERRETVLRPRSLLVLSGPARYEWQHAIPARKSDAIGGASVPRSRRVSLTFRTVVLAE